MSGKSNPGEESNVVLDEDIKKILSTVKRVPNGNVSQSSKGTKSGDRKKRNITRFVTVLSVITIILIVGIFLVIRGLRKSSTQLKGTWSYDEVTIYQFDGEGHGSLVLPLGTYGFSYTVENDLLKLDFIDESILDQSYNYSLTQDILIMTGQDGTTYQFTRIERTQ